MKDTIIANTGNSRYLKSGISASTTWEEFRAMLIAGSAPIDLNGLNNEGITQLGTLLNTANLLPASVCQALGLNGNTAVPADALSALADFGSWYMWKKWNYVNETRTITQLDPVTEYDRTKPYIAYNHGSHMTIVFSAADSYIAVDNRAELVNPVDVTCTFNYSHNYVMTGFDALIGKYIRYKSCTKDGTGDVSDQIFNAEVLYVDPNTILSFFSNNLVAMITNTIGLKQISARSDRYNSKQGAVIALPMHPNGTTYPTDGKSGNFWFERIGTVAQRLS